MRKIYIDLGIRIQFGQLDQLKNRPSKKIADDVKARIPYHAIGTIHYCDADGGGEDGYVLYIKPAYHGTSATEGAGVRSYATANPTFPHESTGDQWFTESQFESYRSLGLDIVNAILAEDIELAPPPVQDGKHVPALTLSAMVKSLAPTTI